MPKVGDKVRIDVTIQGTTKIGDTSGDITKIANGVAEVTAPFADGISMIPLKLSVMRAVSPGAWEATLHLNLNP